MRFLDHQQQARAETRWLLLVLGGWWVDISQLRAGGLRLAQRVSTRELRPSVSHAEQRFSNVLDALCIAGGVPRPQLVLLARTEAINAFAAGWDEHSAIIAVTQEALDQLTRNELQGMVAHKLSHLREGDTRMNMQLAGMVYGLKLVYNFGDSLRERGGLGTWFGSAIMVAGFAGWLAGRVLQAAVSRLAAHSLQLEPLPVLQLNARPPKLVTDIMPCVPCSPALLEYQHEDATHQRPSPLLAHPLCR